MTEKQIKTAIEFLKIGQSFRIENLRLGVENSKTLYITGWSNYSYIENLTKEIALRELQEIKVMFKKILAISKELRDFIEDKSFEYNLAFNYGQGSIGICSEKKGKVTWETSLK